MIRSRILGVGSYLPPQEIKNDDLTRWMETSDGWIQQRTGIRSRYWVDQNAPTSTSDLALEACNDLFQRTGIKKEEVDLIIFATLSPDHDFPGTGCFLQAKLGLPGIPVLDVRQQCTGFLYGMSIADQFVRSGTYRRILLVGAEVHSKGLDKSTRGRDVSVLFGDGAGAVLIGPKDESRGEILSVKLHADGRFARELWMNAPTNARPGDRLQPGDVESGMHFPQMNGRTVFANAVRRMPEVLLEGLEQARVALNDVDLFVFHQANLRINEAVAKALGIPDEKVFNTIDRFANTTAATIPLGLSTAEKEGRLKPGMLVASAAFGSGFTWASALYRW